jgi:hypothetical protein
MRRWLWAFGLAAGIGCSAGGTDLGGNQDGSGGGNGDAGASDAGAGGQGDAGQGDAGQGGQGTAGTGDPGNAGAGGQSNAGSPGTAGSGDAGNGSAGTDAAGGASGGAGTGPGGAAGQSDCPDGVTKQAIVYANSPDTLYRLDPDTKAVTKIGSIDPFGCGTVIDLAVNKSGEIYGTTFTGLIRIDKTTAKCNLIKAGDYPNSLSFVPVGTVFPDKEALVGYQGSTYVVIDPVTGAVTNKGSIGGGYESSGDIVSVIGGGTYLTVKGNNCQDCVVRVDPSTGALIENLGQLSYGSVFGLAYWGGVVFGFTEGGELFAFDVLTKATSAIQIPNAPGGLTFYGAGSTTCARVSEIK